MSCVSCRISHGISHAISTAVKLRHHMGYPLFVQGISYWIFTWILQFTAPSLFIELHWLLLPLCAVWPSLLPSFLCPQSSFFSFLQLPPLKSFVAMIVHTSTARCSPQTACFLSHCLVWNPPLLPPDFFP